MKSKKNLGAFYYRRPAGNKTGLSGAALSLRPPLRGGRFAPLQLAPSGLAM
jgi:hypothetical protein